MLGRRRTLSSRMARYRSSRAEVGRMTGRTARSPSSIAPCSLSRAVILVCLASTAAFTREWRGCRTLSFIVVSSGESRGLRSCASEERCGTLGSPESHYQSGWSVQLISALYYPLMPVALYRTMSPVQVKIGTMPVFHLLRGNLLCHREQGDRNSLADMLNRAMRRANHQRRRAFPSRS
jgi:hypothetical protein